MRLAYRIATSKCCIPSNIAATISVEDHARLDGFKTIQAEMIKKSPKILLDNVSDYLALHPQSQWGIEDDVPNMAPPFHMFWAEWNESNQMLINGRMEGIPDTQSQLGCMCINAEIKDESREHANMWQKLIFNLSGFDVPLEVVEVSKQVEESLKKAKWLLSASYWSYGPSICHVPIYLGACAFVFVDANGRALSHSLGGALVNFWNTHGSEGQGGLNSIFYASSILGLGLSFMHCKNVKQTEAVELATAKNGERFHRQRKIPKYTFRTLEINPMKEVLRKEGNIEANGLKKALHICRGHFATYSPDHPLFGKYVGTFWKPDHVRGSEEYGKVVKNYAVKVGQ